MLKKYLPFHVQANIKHKNEVMNPTTVYVNGLVVKEKCMKYVELNSVFLEEKGDFVTYENIEGTGEYYVKQNKPSTGGKI